MPRVLKRARCYRCTCSVRADLPLADILKSSDKRIVPVQRVSLGTLKSSLKSGYRGGMSMYLILLSTDTTLSTPLLNPPFLLLRYEGSLWPACVHSEAFLPEGRTRARHCRNPHPPRLPGITFWSISFWVGCAGFAKKISLWSETDAKRGQFLFSFASCSETNQQKFRMFRF